MFNAGNILRCTQLSFQLLPSVLFVEINHCSTNNVVHASKLNFHVKKKIKDTITQ